MSPTFLYSPRRKEPFRVLPDGKSKTVVTGHVLDSAILVRADAREEGGHTLRQPTAEKLFLNPKAKAVAAIVGPDNPGPVTIRHVRGWGGPIKVKWRKESSEPVSSYRTQLIQKLLPLRGS